MIRALSAMALVLGAWAALCLLFVGLGLLLQRAFRLRPRKARDLFFCF